MEGSRAEPTVLSSSLYRPAFLSCWPRTSVHSLATWINGMAFRNIHFTPTGRPVIKIAELKNGIAGQTKFTDAEYEARYLVTAGDMVFSWSGQPETSIDVFWWRGPDGWLNQHIFKVLPNEERCLPGFLFYLLKYLKPNFIAIARNKQTTGLGHVTKTDLENIEVGTPPRPLQQAIAHILGTLDDKIELNRRMNETLEAMARALFKSWFVDFDPVRAKAEGRDHGLPQEIADLFPDRFQESDIGRIPKGWFAVPLPETIEVNPPRSLRKGEIAPYLDMANMPTRSSRALNVHDREFRSGMRFIDGDTLVARITPCLENGKTCFVDFLGPGKAGWGSTEYTVLRPKPPVPAEFGYFLARTEGFRSFAMSNMTGTSGRQRVPADCFDHFLIVIPPAEIAGRFGRLAHAVLGRMKANDDESCILAGLRDALLPKLLSGEIRVKDAEKFVEGAR